MKTYLITCAALFIWGLNSIPANADLPPGFRYSADKLIQHTESGIVDLIGHAKVSSPEKEMTADKIVLNLKTGSAQGEGAVKFSAKKLRVDFAAAGATSQSN